MCVTVYTLYMTVCNQPTLKDCVYPYICWLGLGREELL